MVGLVHQNGITYAGKHLLIDLHECENHGSLKEIEDVMIASCKATGATVLYSYLHPFTGGGVSGAVILAESHQSIHTWPEENLVTLDIFVCGECDPYLAVPILQNWFRPSKSLIKMQIRGQIG